MGASLPCAFFLFIICTNSVIAAETQHNQSIQEFQVSLASPNNTPESLKKRKKTPQDVRAKRSIEELNTKDKQEGFENNHQILVVTTTAQNFLDNEIRGSELLRFVGIDAIFIPRSINVPLCSNRDLPPLSVVKRAPMGFMGMRGKKEYEYTDMDKRVLQGFHGVRGKKILLKIPYRFAPKRAPSGFMGMRGKKLLVSEYDSNKRAPSGFMGKNFISTDSVPPSNIFLKKRNARQKRGLRSIESIAKR